MKKIIIGLIIIVGATLVILHVIPVAAQSNPNVALVTKTDPPKLLVQIAPPPAVPPKATSTPVKKTATVKQTAPKISASTAPKSSVSWASSGLKAIGSLASFDYSTRIRSAYMRKVEAYAKSRGITLITASVVNSMHQ